MAQEETMEKQVIKMEDGRSLYSYTFKPAKSEEGKQQA